MLAQKGGRGQRGVHIAGNFHVLDIGVVAGAVAHDQVGIFSHHIQQGNGHLQGNINLGIGHHELRELRNQQAPRKGGRDRNLQPLAPGR